MNYTLATLLLALASIGLILLLARRILIGWVEYRVKLRLLQRLEQRPELLPHFQQLAGDLMQPAAGSGRNRLSAGVFLLLWGVMGMIGADLLLEGRYATAAYLGGVVCLVLGFLYIMAGLLARYLAGQGTQH